MFVFYVVLMATGLGERKIFIHTSCIPGKGWCPPDNFSKDPLHE